MRRELVRVHLDAHGGFLRAVDVHLRDAAHDRDALGDRLRVRVDHRERKRRGLQHEKHHRLIGRVVLLQRGRRRHVRRQGAGRPRDHRLHVGRGRVDVAGQVELQRDVGLALRARGVDRRQARNRRELLFERQRHGRRHRLGIRTGQAGLYLDGGKVDNRQVADRQQPVRHRAEHQNTQHDERRRDRTLDEERGEVHGSTFWLAAPGPDLMLTLVPGTRRSWPSVTTVSSGFRPLSTIVVSAFCR